ncbi:hypothetical protein ACIRPR_29685 [Streptomyces griseoflavus]|uniref:hypothetical protein n=1 Tax=Streptomyces griseoflavus TaxID=35619 RepID=UPI00382C551F
MSLTCGNEYRKDASDTDLLKILDMYSQLEGPYLYDHDNDQDLWPSTCCAPPGSR